MSNSATKVRSTTYHLLLQGDIRCCLSTAWHREGSLVGTTSCQRGEWHLLGLFLRSQEDISSRIWGVKGVTDVYKVMTNHPGRNVSFDSTFLFQQSTTGNKHARAHRSFSLCVCFAKTHTLISNLWPQADIIYPSCLPLIQPHTFKGLKYKLLPIIWV